MTSLLQDLARNYYSVVVGFGQVFLACGVLVAIAYWAKVLLFPRRREPIARKPQARRPPRHDGARAKPLPNSREIAQAPAPARTGPMSPDVHWERASAPVRLTIARGERARELHDRALVRLESADYTLRRLMVELADVMPLRQEAKVSQPIQPVREAPEDTPRLAA